MTIPKSVTWHIDNQKVGGDYVNSQLYQLNLFKVLTGRLLISLSPYNPPNSTLHDLIKQDGGFTMVKEEQPGDRYTKRRYYKITEKLSDELAMKIAIVDEVLKNKILAKLIQR